MVRAILDGNKTQTRRIVKGNPKHITEYVEGPLGGDKTRTGNFGLHFESDRIINRDVLCPYGKPGDRIWVRETVSRFAMGTHVAYKADYSESEAEGTKWRPSIHMPRWASRITLEVVSVRVERLNDCSMEDALAEGVSDSDPDTGAWQNPKEEFADLWESINGPGSWDANPWVWVVEFKRIKP